MSFRLVVCGNESRVRYHVVDENGKIEICRNKRPDKCPYKHFLTLKEAVDYVEDNNIEYTGKKQWFFTGSQNWTKFRSDVTMRRLGEKIKDRNVRCLRVPVVNPQYLRALALSNVCGINSYTDGSKSYVEGIEITGLSQEGMKFLCETGILRLPLPIVQSSDDFPPFIIIEKEAFSKENIKADIRAVTIDYRIKQESGHICSPHLIIGDGAFDGQDQLRLVDFSGVEVNFIGKNAFRGTNILSYIATSDDGNGRITVTVDKKPLPDTLRVLYSDYPMWQDGKLPYYPKLRQLLLPYGTVRKSNLNRYEGKLDIITPYFYSDLGDDFADMNIEKMKRLQNRGYVTWLQGEESLKKYAKKIDLTRLNTAYNTYPFLVGVVRSMEDEKLKRIRPRQAGDFDCEGKVTLIEGLLTILFGEYKG